MFAGFLRGEPVGPCATNRPQVPADAEILRLREER
jgi:3-polyprenyl-4-hydroxybenzoate decarboxylase